MHGVSPKGRAMLRMVARNFSWISAEVHVVVGLDS